MNRPILVALGWLLLVLAGIAAAVLWWWGQRAPDVRLDPVLRLVPLGPTAPRLPIPLEGGTRRAWSVPAGDDGLRFAVTVPGDDPVLRFAEATLQGKPDVAVRLIDDEGTPREIAVLQATEEAWRLRRVPLPAGAGDELLVELAALDGRGRPGLGQVLLADVALESAGRPIDESLAALRVEAVVADLLAGSGAGLRRVPPDADAERVTMPGPLALPLEPGRALRFELTSVPEQGRLHVVLHAAKAAESSRPLPAHVTLSLDGRAVARVRVDELALPPGRRRPPHEVLVSQALEARPGTPLMVELSLTGGDSLSVAVREAYVTAVQSRPRRRFDPAKDRNLLLVLVDGLRADRLTPWGYGRGHTPVLDGLARRGMVYTEVYGPSSWRVPNLATLLTGLSPVQHGLGLLEGRVLSPRVTTLARSAGWAGMMTALMSNSGVGERDRGLTTGYERVVRAEVGAPVLVEHALDWLAEARQFAWFLTLHLGDPTWPHEPERPDLAVLDGAPDPERLARLRRLDSRPGVAEAVEQEVGVWLDAEIARVDRALGLVLDDLSARGLLEHTVVAVVGVHGQEVYEHNGRFQGETLFDDVVHVPVILAGPGVVDPRDAPVRVGQPVDLADVTHLVGHVGRVLSTGSIPDRVPPPFGPDRPSTTHHALLRPFEGVTRSWLEASRRDGLLLVHDVATGERRLFDRGADPLAQHDLLAGARPGDPAPGQAEALTEAFEAWFTEQVLEAPARPVSWEP